MRFTRRSLSTVGASLAAAAVIFAACTDRDSNPLGPSGGGENPKGPPAGAQPTIQIECRADVRGRSVDCAPVTPATGANADMINSIYLGNQGVNVRLRSSNIAVTADTFAFNERIINLLPQAIGTTDGTTPDPAGSQVYFANNPSIATTSGTGQVEIVNADSVGTFTASNQPLFKYVGRIAPGDSTADKTWKFRFDPGVNTFSFRVYVYTPVQFPQGWIDVTPSVDTLNLNQKDTLLGIVRNAHNQRVGGFVTWKSSDSTIAKVVSLDDSTAEVTAVGSGNATITATNPSGMSAPYGLRSGTASIVVNSQPTVVVNNFPALRNVTVPRAAPGLLTGISDPEGQPVTVVGTTFTTWKGGTVQVLDGATGSFTYLGPANFSGVDSVTYTVSDGVRTSTAKAAFNVASNRVWFVKAGASGTTDGRDAFPFATVAAAEAVAAAGDSILVLANGAQQVDGPAQLQNGQALIGQGISTSIKHGFAPGDSVTVLAAGSAPGLTRTTAGATVTLAQNNTIRGVGITSSAGAAISGSSFGTLTVSAVTVNAAGPSLDLTSGTLAADFTTLHSNGSATTGLSLVSVSGNLTAGGASIRNAAGNGLNVAGGSLSFTFPGVITNSGGAGVSITSITGGALALSDSISGSGNGIVASSNSGGTITFAGPIADAGNGITVNSNTGAAITFSGPLALTAKGITAGSNTAGTIAFDGASKTLDTKANAAVTLTSNSGATLRFANGGLVITTTTGAGFAASGGGTVQVSGTGNTISTTTGQALNLNGIASEATNGIAFASVSTSGSVPTNAIALSNLTGRDVQVNGGTLPAAGGHTVSLTTLGSLTNGVTLNNLSISGGTGGNSAIFGTSFGTLAVSGTTVSSTAGPALNLTTGTVNGTFTSVSANVSSTKGVILSGIAGTFTASGGTVTGGSDSAFVVRGGTVGVTWNGGISQANSAPAIAVTGGHATGTLTFNGSVSATSGTGLQFDNADGTYVFAGTTTLNGGDAGIDIVNGSGGTFTFPNSTSITNPSGTAFNVSSSAPTVTYGGNITKSGTSAGRLVSVNTQASGTITFQGGTLSSTSSAGTGILLKGANGTVNFKGTTTLNGGTAAIQDSASSGTAQFDSTASVTNSGAMPAVTVAGGAPTFTFAGPVSHNSGVAVNVQSITGGTVQFKGNVSATAATNGIVVNGATGGTVSFTGASKSLSTSTASAVALTSNTGATINFGGGGLVITTTSGSGFTATGGGTVQVTGTGNTVSSGSGTAVSLNGIATGASGITFQSVSANGGANGISIVGVNTGGGFQVTGTTTAGSGGTIQNITGADGATAGNGVYLSNVANVNLSWMNFTGIGNNGIWGQKVAGFNANKLRFTGTTGTSNSGTFEESTIHLRDVSGGVKITNSRLDGSAWDGILVRNTLGTSPTLDSLVIANDTVSSMQGSLADVRNSAFQALVNDGTADIRIRNNVATYWWGAATQVVVGLTGSATARINNNTFTNTSGAAAASGNIAVSGGNLAFNISNNTLTGADGAAITADKNSGNNTFNGTIDGNTVGTSGVANSGSKSGTGIFTQHSGPGSTTVKISNNVVRQINGSQAIWALLGDDVGGGGAGTLNVTITGNNIAEEGSSATTRTGIIVQSGRVTGDTDQMCADVASNSITNFNTRIRPNQRFDTKMRMPGYTGAAGDNTAVNTYIVGRNPGTTSVTSTSTAGGGGIFNTSPAGSACPQPSI